MNDVSTMLTGRKKAFIYTDPGVYKGFLSSNFLIYLKQIYEK